MSRDAPLPVREQTVSQMGADVAVQLMLMMLFACMSQLANRADVFQAQLHDELLKITRSVNLPPGSENVEQEVRDAARTVISNVFIGAEAIHFSTNET